MLSINNTRDDEYVTTITLRINFKELTFKDLTRRERRTSRSSKPPCSCARLHDIHPYHSVRDIAQGLKPSDVITARFVMTSLENVQQAEKLCTPDPDLKFEHPREFEFWILSLAVLLANLCEGDHSSRPRVTPPTYGLRPFKNGEVLKKHVCEEVRRLLMTPLNPTEKIEHGMGYIYILRSQRGSSTVGELKIGFSKYHPEHRAHEIASCYAQPEVISHTPLLPHAKRLESIIHMELQTIRKVHLCRKCKGEHREWFTMMHGDSREIVMRWSRWILKQPYVNGELTQEWKAYLANKDFGSVDEDVALADLWQSIIDDFPGDNLYGSESERIGTYLNQCHWDNICTQMGIDELEKIDKCDKCRQYALKWRQLKSFPFPQSDSEMDSAIERLSRMGLGIDEVLGPCDCRGIPDFGPVYRDKEQSIDPEQPIGSWVDKNTRLGRIFHPATPTSHILSQEGSPGILVNLIQRQQEEEKSAQEELFDHIVLTRAIKTGARSVSDPHLGRTESPLGDATLLPVLALKDLDHIGALVGGWVGYTPTHCGFQYLQEAYREGQWLGRKPQFKLPKAYRTAGLRAVPMPDRKTAANSDKEMRDASETSGASSVPDPNMPHGKHSGSAFTFSRGPGFGQENYTFSLPMNETTMEHVEQLEQICKYPAGRAMVEREFVRSLKRHGVDASYDMPDVGDDSTSDEMSDSDEAYRFASPPPIIPAKRTENSDSREPQISAKKAKQWLESL